MKKVRDVLLCLLAAPAVMWLWFVTWWLEDKDDDK